MSLTFAHPWFLILLLPLMGWLAWYILYYPGKRLRLALSYDPEKLRGGRPSLHLLRWLPVILKVLAIAFWILALARPQSAGELRIREEDGIDILLLLDVSASMETEDFQPSRLETAKSVCSDFVQARPQDRIGLVLFAENAFTYVPLTLDHDLLRQLISQIQPGIMPKQGTAVGSAISAGINRFQDSESITKVMILITDGASNRGKIDPLNSARLAANKGIRVYTIGVGKESFTVRDPAKGMITQQTDLDVPALQQVSEITGAQFYRADSPQALEDIFESIHALEKNIFASENDRRIEDRYPLFIKTGLVLFALSLVFQIFSWYNPLEE
jgi:Ca-activated chloride channel family protein